MNAVEETVLARMGTIEKDVASIAKSNEAVSLALTHLVTEQATARECRASMRDGILDVKTMVIEMRDEGSRERAAMSTQMTFRTKPGTIVKVLTGLVVAILGFFAARGPDAAAVAQEVEKVIK